MTSPRERTRQHLERLAAAAAVASTVAAADACRGYAVVDPMPPPSRCAGASDSLKVTAAWIDTPNGRRVEVILSPSATPGTAVDPKSAMPQYGETIDESTTTSDGGTRIVFSPKLTTAATLSLHVDCTATRDAGPPGMLAVELRFDDYTKTTGKIEVYLRESG